MSPAALERGPGGRRVQTFRSALAVPPEQVWTWHLRPGALLRLSPPWEPVAVLDPGRGVADGSRVVLQVGRRPLALRWVAEHRDVRPGQGFTDVQRTGPFREWEHVHRFRSAPGGGCLLEDRVAWRLPLGAAGATLLAGAAARRVERTFAWRHRITARDLDRHAPFVERPRLRVLLLGEGGALGRDLAAFLETGGHDVLRLAWSGPAGAGLRAWARVRSAPPPAGLEGLDAVLHLEAVAARARRPRGTDPGSTGVQALLEALARLERPPRVVACASSLAARDEQGRAASDERAWATLARAGSRVVRLRFGLLLDPAGDRPPPAEGPETLAWVGLDDAVGAVHHVLQTPTLTGPVDIVAPERATPAALAEALSGVTGRWSRLVTPWRSPGAGGAPLVAAAHRPATPEALLASGFRFADEDPRHASQHRSGRGPCARLPAAGGPGP